MVAMSVVASLYQDGLLDYEQILIIVLSFSMIFFVSSYSTKEDQSIWNNRSYPIFLSFLLEKEVHGSGVVLIAFSVWFVSHEIWVRNDKYSGIDRSLKLSGLVFNLLFQVFRWKTLKWQQNNWKRLRYPLIAHLWSQVVNCTGRAVSYLNRAYWLTSMQRGRRVR